MIFILSLTIRLVFAILLTADNIVLVKEKELELLKQFDLNTNYGPCSGIMSFHFIFVISVSAFCLMHVVSLVFSVLCGRDIPYNTAVSFIFFSLKNGEWKILSFFFSTW